MAPHRWQRRTLSAAFVATVGAASASASLLVACSAVLGIDSDRHVVASLGDTDSGPSVVSDAGVDSGVPANWACIDTAVPTPSTDPVKIKLFVNDVSTASKGDYAGSAVVGAKIRACGTLDLVCASPIAATTSDDAGIAQLTLPPQFRGYYELTADGFTPSVISRPPQNRSEYSQQGLANLTLIELGGGLAGLTVDANLAIAIVSVIDCNNAPAANMVIDVGDLGPGEQVVYLEKTLPTASAHGTDETGSAIIYNVPLGTLTVAAKFANTGRLVRSISTIARSRWATYVQIRLDQATAPFSDAGP